MRSQKPSQRAARGPRIARKRPRMRLAEQGRPDCRELAKAAGAGGQAGSEAAGGARRATTARSAATRQPAAIGPSPCSQGARGAPGGTRQPATQPARTANSATRRPWHQELDRRGRNSTGAEGGSGELADLELGPGELGGGGELDRPPNSPARQPTREGELGPASASRGTRPETRPLLQVEGWRESGEGAGR